MRDVTPTVHLIGRPRLEWQALADYLKEVGGEAWLQRLAAHEHHIDAQDLTEAAGRLCYRSWEPGLNPNVTRVREDQEEYLRNILASAHGSVLEHAQFSFVFGNVSRIFSHELVRHRVGVAVSQESLRFVRLTELPFWIPEWARDDEELMGRASALIQQMEEFQLWAAQHFGLDDDGVPFAEKKHRTSFMRRFAPEGVATSMVWSANVRTLRHVIEVRTAAGAEEEIRLVFAKVGEIMRREVPALFGDFEVTGDGAWVPGWRKV